MKSTDIRPVGTELTLLPVETRVPLKFGAETLRSVECARVRLRVRDRGGREADGWGETPLSVQWVWPSPISYSGRLAALKDFCGRLAKRWAEFEEWGSALEVGYRFIEDALSAELSAFNGEREAGEEMPLLAALVCCSAFDIALHDAFGNIHQKDTYALYGPEFANTDLAGLIEAAPGSSVSFAGKHVSDFIVLDPPKKIPVWHLVGGLDPIDASELKGDEPDDDYPVLLKDWIGRDGLKCLKIKLRGNDAAWDYERLVDVGELSLATGVEHLTTDFNCTVKDPDYVNGILDQLKEKHPKIWDIILYVEQPFPYDLEANPIDVRSLSKRKPLFMDESAHDWKLVRLGYELGWTGVALKTCKTQTGALLSLSWAKAHGMDLMVQDLTNPMMAQVPHARLGAHAGTIMGVESNGMQFYPDASLLDAKIHPGLYSRREGVLDLSTLGKVGFGYRENEVGRVLPEASCRFGDIGK